MPSPTQFDYVDIQSGSRTTASGYCNRRKDSLAIFKDADGDWHIIHKASGLTVNAMRAPSIKKYPALLALCAYVQSNAAEALAIVDQLPFHPAVKSDEQKAALTKILQVGLAFKG